MNLPNLFPAAVIAVARFTGAVVARLPAASIARFASAARLPRLALAAALSLSLGGCFVYRVDIQQGNEITPQMLAELELGMSQTEVGKILGYPLVQDPFHADRWDYYFYLKKGDDGEVQQHSATLYFTDDSLNKIQSRLPGSE